MLTAAVVTALLLAFAIHVRAAQATHKPSKTLRRPTPAVIRFWTRVAHCETDGDWRMEGPTYSGALGFYNRTWTWWASELGLVKRYPNAGMAPRIVQVEVADFGYRIHAGYWGSISSGCAGAYP